MNFHVIIHINFHIGRFNDTVLLEFVKFVNVQTILENVNNGS